MDISKTIGGLSLLRVAFMNNKEEKEILDNAISILKRMEPKEMELEGGGSSWWHVCPECHGMVDEYDHFCRHCGQALKGAGE